MNFILPQGGKKILELCSGPSLFIDYALLNPNNFIISINTSEIANEITRKQYRDSTPNMRFRHGYPENMDYDQHFDMVVSTYSIQFSNDKSKAIENIKKSLKHNGLFTLKTPMKTPYPLSNALQHPKWSEYLKNVQNVEYLNKESYDCLLGRYFENYHIKKYHNRFFFKDFEHIFDWAPHVLEIPEEYREEFKQDVKNEYLKEQPLNKDGTITFPLQIIEAMAAKQRFD
jgi:SAM-dependent methyltransferase